jgi:hypothetical protein
MGASTPDTLVDLILEGEEQNDYFGYALTTHGDINLDSIPDLCVGSYGCDLGDSTEVGKCFIFHGGDSLAPPADMVIWSGATDNEAFGASVALIGSDGILPSYLLVGAEGSDVSGVDAGRIYAFVGPSPEAGMPDDEAEGSEPGASLGCDVYLLKDFTTSAAGVLALSGAYDEGLSGRARLFGMCTASFLPSISRQTQEAVKGNPFRVGDLIQFEESAGKKNRGVLIVDVMGRLVFSAQGDGESPIFWDGSTSSGSLAAPGTYFYVLSPSSRRGKIILLE